ncbi:oligosaccharide flippase family protein [Flavobacterium hungaricum]|uniref:Polysaccharide biosynthesis protein n=1 Tax=Flavobacterium hungaricum TaxID=2082725 RepID=A0ABR9TPT6_9FLAO|nr:oligosaccharide flippase family protein [Flavobacterium hungaricum]MBE8727054.1 hypothetical protein [Flavobacterium hungaricum]
MKKIYKIKDRVLKSKFTVDSFWALFGNIIAKGLALTSGILVARFLGKDVYGEFGMIKNTLMSLAIFSTLGLGYTSTKFIAEYKLSKPDYIPLILKYCRLITLSVSSFLTLIFFFTAKEIAYSILENVNLEIPLKFMSFWLIFNAVSTTQLGILAGFGSFKEIAKNSIITGIATFMLSLLLTFFFGLKGALTALLIVQILDCFLNYRQIKINCNELIINSVRDKSFLKEILLFSIPVSLQEGVYALTSWLISLILIKFSNYGELGMYSAAIQWSVIILFIPGIMRNVILTHLSEQKDNLDNHKRILKLTIIVNVVMTMIPVIIVIAISSFLGSIYGTSYNGISTLINLAVLSTVFISISNVYSQAYMSIGKNWIMLGFRVIRDFGIIGFFFVVKFFFRTSAEAILFSVFILNFLFMILMAVYYKWKLN